MTTLSCKYNMMPFKECKKTFNVFLISELEITCSLAKIPTIYLSTASLVCTKKSRFIALKNSIFITPTVITARIKTMETIAIMKVADPAFLTKNAINTFNPSHLNAINSLITAKLYSTPNAISCFCFLTLIS